MGQVEEREQANDSHIAPKANVDVREADLIRWIVARRTVIHHHGECALTAEVYTRLVRTVSDHAAESGSVVNNIEAVNRNVNPRATAREGVLPLALDTAICFHVRCKREIRVAAGWFTNFLAEIRATHGYMVSHPTNARDIVGPGQTWSRSALHMLG